MTLVLKLTYKLSLSLSLLSYRVAWRAPVSFTFSFICPSHCITADMVECYFFFIHLKDNVNKFRFLATSRLPVTVSDRSHIDSNLHDAIYLYVLVACAESESVKCTSHVSRCNTEYPARQCRHKLIQLQGILRHPVGTDFTPIHIYPVCTQADSNEDQCLIKEESLNV